MHSGGVSSGHYYTFVRVRESCFFASSFRMWVFPKIGWFQTLLKWMIWGVFPYFWIDTHVLVGFPLENPSDNSRFKSSRYSGEGKSQWIKFDDDAWHAAVEKRCHSGDSRDSREKTMCGIHVRKHWLLEKMQIPNAI